LSFHINIPNSFEAGTATEKLKSYKSPGFNQILTEMTQGEGETLCSEIHKFINYNWNKEKLPQQWKESIIVPIYKRCNKTVVMTMELHIKFCPIFFSEG
jgi:hypothetical protein